MCKASPGNKLQGLEVLAGSRSELPGIVFVFFSNSRGLGGAQPPVKPGSFRSQKARKAEIARRQQAQKPRILKATKLQKISEARKPGSHRRKARKPWKPRSRTRKSSKRERYYMYDASLVIKTRRPMRELNARPPTDLDSTTLSKQKRKLALHLLSNDLKLRRHPSCPFLQVASPALHPCI